MSPDLPSLAVGRSVSPNSIPIGAAEGPGILGPHTRREAQIPAFAALDPGRGGQYSPGSHCPTGRGIYSKRG